MVIILIIKPTNDYDLIGLFFMKKNMARFGEKGIKRKTRLLTRIPPQGRFTQHDLSSQSVGGQFCSN